MVKNLPFNAGDLGLIPRSGRFPSRGDLPDSGIKPGFPALQAGYLPSEPPGRHNPKLNINQNMDNKGHSDESSDGNEEHV